MLTSASPEFENRLTSHLPTKVFKGHTGEVRSVAYFRDSNRIVSGSKDKTVRIWNVESGKQDGQTLEHDFGVQCISISPDGRTLAVSGSDRVIMWNLENRSVVWKIEEGVDGWRVAFPPNEQLVAATANNGIVLLDAETGQRIRGLLQFDEPKCLFFASGSCRNGNQCRFSHGVNAAFSPDGTQLVVGSSTRDARVFDMATGKTIVGPVGAHTNKVPSVLFTSDGKQFITASLDKSIRVWDSTTGKEVGDPMLGHEEGIHQIALSHDGHRLASVDGVTVRVWDLTTRRQVGDRLQAPDEFSFYSIAWSLNGRSIVAGTREGEIDLWDVPSLEVEDSAMTPVVVAGHPPQPSSPRPRTDSLSPSILDLPAAGPSNQSKSSQPPRRDDFWDTSDIDLPARACPQISTIPIAEIPLKPSIPRTSKAKTALNVPSTSPSAPDGFFGRIGSRFRRDKYTPKTIEMQPPSPKIPKYSPVGKVALGQADARLYRAKSKERKPSGDESGQEEWADVEVNCWDIFCAIITSCFLSSSKDSRGDGG